MAACGLPVATSRCATRFSTPLWSGAARSGRGSLTVLASLYGQSQGSVPAPAGGQPAVQAEAGVRSADRRQPRAQELPEPGVGDRARRRRSTLGSRYHLDPAAHRVCVPGPYSGRLLAPRDRLGAGWDRGGQTDVGGSTHDARTPGSTAGGGAPPPSRRAVCQRRPCRTPESAGDRHQHAA